MALIKNTFTCRCQGECRIVKYDKVLGLVYYRCDECKKEYRISLEEAITADKDNMQYFELNENGEISFKVAGSFLWCEGVINMDEDENMFWLEQAYSSIGHDSSNSIRGA